MTFNCKLLIITRGKNGCDLIYRNKKYSYPVDKETMEIDDSGAGDILFSNISEVISVLKKLWEEYWIVKFCYTGNCVYLLQDIHDREWNRLSSSSKMYSEQEKASLQQRTMDYIHQSEFLSLFSLT